MLFWVTTGFTKGDIIYASADNVLNKLAIGGTDGYVLKVTSAANKTLGWAAETGGSGGSGSSPWQTNGNKIYYSTDNVGINVSDPAFDLDVHGTANVGALTATSLSVDGQTLALASDLTANASRLDAIYTGSLGDLIYVDSGNTLTKLTIGSAGQVLTVVNGVPAWAAATGGGGGGGGGTSQWTTVNTNEIHYNGNVGIANADPGHDLSVGSNLYVDDDGSNVLVVTGNTAMAALTLGQVSIAASYNLEQIVNIGNTSSNVVQLTNATTGLVATGNVHALAYHGDGTFLTGLNLEHVANEGNATSNTVRFTNTTTGLVTTANVEVGGELTVSGNATVSSNLTVTGNVEVGTANLFVDTANSRIGIGTVSPDEKLHVNGNIRLGGPQGTDENASYYIKSAGQIHINSATDGAADDSYICLDLRAGQSGSNRSGIGICGAATSTTYQHIAFETTDAERMRINYDGNIGIGTTAPSAKLQVGGNAETGPQYLWIRGHRVNQAGDICGIHFYNSAASGDRGNSRILSSRGTNNYGSNLEFWTNPDSNVPATQRMCILANGNVGVGTTAPAAIFEVVGGYTTSPIKKTAPTAPTYEYNYFLNAPRPGTTSGGAVHFVNGSTRSGDGGNSTYTIRNDTGQLRLGHSSYTTLFQGTNLRMDENDNSFFHFGPNGTWSGELYVGATTDRTSSSYTTKAQVIVTDGNLHLDAGNARDIYMNYYRGNYIRHHGLGVYSDDRLKSEEELLTNATDTLLKLSPQKYLKRHTLREDEDRDPLVETGLIAQDIWYDAPELRHLVQLGDDANPTDIKPEAPIVGDIQQDPDYSSWGPKEASVNYNGLIAYLIKSNQELHNRIQALENA